ncbi:conserved hypothetical protein [Pirellula staleyi DSM 6068]|uniref:Helicase HerA central domain-containing protein n=1 Tax=Pirellula staleyi (strain ATCC 27377 / DSM 6068 / ICPB 4128) TaxID=530564 RepID=D2R3Z2_PIRSD|nr:conserved hypothetical protein [Pirellula staleyi DSM 6068]
MTGAGALSILDRCRWLPFFRAHFFADWTGASWLADFYNGSTLLTTLFIDLRRLIMQDYERLGVFYLGREYDLAAAAPKEQLLLYDTKDLTTHAVCVGMTGSGKTGLCLSLLEEAAIDGIPALIIDPKGDLGNLLLTFPNLEPSDFQPWIEPAEATRAGCTVEEYAAKTAAKYREGLAAWGQDPSRIERFKKSADVAIYTPGSSSGLPLAVLRSFACPGAATLENSESLRDTITAAVSGLLGLLGIEADPLQSREHILLSNILDRSWCEGKDVAVADLVRLIQSPPIERVGVIDLESFYAAKDRFALAMRLNNLLASPGFSTWMEGQPLDIQQLLYTPEGRPRLAIISIAHLSDSERMFFVTLLLNATLGWMRSQAGTSSLRAILYMDEVFGYFPPTANPPSKLPMLTLLKQARAFGLGVVLATQNPVDLDYKGLANCGTWFLGRLQTERDKMRVLDGLEGASTAAGQTFNRSEMEAILSGLGNRVFLLNNVHDDAPVVFQTRWALSYLRGPLTRQQISGLMQSRKESLPAATVRSAAAVVANSAAAATSSAQTRPVLPPDVKEQFVPARKSLPADSKLVYQPALLASGTVHFVQNTLGISHSEKVLLLAAATEGAASDVWSGSSNVSESGIEFEASPDASAAFGALPGEFSRAKKYTELTTAAKDFLYRSRRLSIWKCAAIKLSSSVGETEAEFRLKIGQQLREARDLAIAKLHTKYAPKLASAQEAIRKAEQKVAKEKAQANEQMMSSVVSIGTSILGAMFGRKLASSTNLGRASTGMKSISRAARERQDISQAEDSVEACVEKLKTLETEFQDETKKLQDQFQADAVNLEQVEIAPKKADCDIDSVILVWLPTAQTSTGVITPLYE